MHIQTHILSGWCIAASLPTTPKQRLCAMIAATIADVDGISILFGQDAYWTYHHTFGHNLFFGSIVSAALCAFTRPRLPSAIFYLALFHLHLLLDYFGSGPGWHIHYLWPTPGAVWINANAWPFYSWQNMLVFAAFFVWTIAIARRQQRTPLEAVFPKLNRDLVALVRRRRVQTADGGLPF